LIVCLIVCLSLSVYLLDVGVCFVRFVYTQYDDVVCLPRYFEYMTAVVCLLLFCMMISIFQVSRQSQWNEPKDFQRGKSTAEIKTATFGMSFYH
jgi:uncharacterized membrane protein